MMKFSFDLTREIIERRKSAAAPPRAWSPGELLKAIRDAQEVTQLRMIAACSTSLYSDQKGEYKSFWSGQAPPVAFAHAQEVGNYGQTIRILLGDHDR